MKMIRSTFAIIALSALITACGGGDSATAPPPDGGPTGDGTASLSWDIPTTKKDGDPLSLTELAGYRIYVTTNINTIPLNPSAEINDGTETQYTITNLPSGTYYIYLTSYDVNGDESDYSNRVEKTIL